jgi:preprotein translocase subunit SecE
MRESPIEMEQQSGSKQPQTRMGEIVEFVPRSVQFVKESWTELKKVHWPSRKETYQATVIVVVVVVVVAIFLGLVDFALSHAMRQILS